MRVYRIWAAALAALGALLCLAPLFNLLSYEFSFALALAASFAAAHLGVRIARAARKDASGSERARADARPLAFVLRLWGRASAGGALLLIAPLGLVTLNALRVRNCDYTIGLAWYALLPLASTVVAAACGLAAGLALPRGALAAAFAVILGCIAVALARIYGAPPIFAYDPFGGYFPGTLYDEEVAITTPLLWARFYHLIGALAALAVAALFLDGTSLRLRVRAVRRRRSLAVLAVALLVAAQLLSQNAARFGFFRNAEQLASALGVEHRTEHFVLHHAPTGPVARDIALYAADHELRFSQLQKWFGAAPKTPIHSFLFESPAHKQSLMGAGHTSIAKPWRREIYLQHEAWPHPVLAHELAHVFAGAWGDRMFAVSRRGWRFNMGMIEGVAVAATWPGSQGTTPHRQVRAMREAGITPPLDALFSLGFLKFAGAQAYTAAGSFVRWLYETHGAEKLGRLYREGGDERAFEAVYGTSRSTLEAEWLKFIDAQPIAEREQKLLEARLRKPSVFQQTCAHAQALRRDAAHAAAAAGDRARALAELEAVCADSPRDPDALLEVMNAARAAGRNDRAESAARGLLAHPGASVVTQARAHSLIGDLAIERDDREAAEKAWAAAEALPLDEASARLLTVKRLVARDPNPPEALIKLLVEPGRDTTLDLYVLQKLVGEAPERGLYHYLLARQLEMRGKYFAAGNAFVRALERGLPDERFDFEALRLLGVSRFRDGKLADARFAFTRLAERAPEPQRLEAQDWLERVAFTERASAKK